MAAADDLSDRFETKLKRRVPGIGARPNSVVIESRKAGLRLFR